MEIPNGSTYDGTFNKGLPNGVGVMRFPDSSRYEGEFMQVDRNLKTMTLGSICIWAKKIGWTNR